MHEQQLEIAGLQTTVVRNEEAERADVVLLHGYAMEPAALSPFAHSLKLPARFLLPRAPNVAPAGGRAWWAVDEPARQAALEHGPRDLADFYPDGRGAARIALRKFLDVVKSDAPARPLILCGFSQGGMLACDYLLMEGDAQVRTLVLMSSSRIAIQEWQQHRAKLNGLQVLISHGVHDDDLAFSAGEQLREFLVHSGARVQWIGFDGGHVITLEVWRELRRLITALV